MLVHQPTLYAPEDGLQVYQLHYGPDVSIDVYQLCFMLQKA